MAHEERLTMKHILQLTDGKRGHEVQVEGLLSALAERSEIRLSKYHVKDKAGLRCLVHAPPQLLLSAGSATHLSLWYWGWRFRAKTVVLMKPGLPNFLFDACIIPEHDQVRGGKNVLSTKGSLNNIRNKTSANPRHGLILIGGPSKHVLWDSVSIATQVNSVVRQNPDIHWHLTTSRRTPEGFLKQLGVAMNLSAHLAVDLPHDWLRTQYAQASVAWVSNDSVNMVYESLTAGLRVGVLNSPSINKSRVMQGLTQLLNQGLITNQVGGVASMPTANTTFDEAGRAADWLIAQGIV